MPILDIQKRARELGRIRIGQVVPTSNGKTRPEKLDRFRLTSASKPLLERVAELYGGQVQQWQPQGGGASAWEVITTSTRLPIMVPPQPVTQWYEYWTGGGCKHRCDGRTNVLTDDLCDPEDFNHREALKRPTTRLNVVLRDVEGIGVWRLETHGWNAAVELPDAAEFLARAGGYVNGWVSLEERTSKAEVPDRQNGGTKVETRRFMVPIIEIDVTPAQLMAGKGRVELEGPGTSTPPAVTGGERPALAAGPAEEQDLSEYYTALRDATTSGEVLEVFERAKAAGILGGNVPATHPLYVAIGERGRAMTAAAEQAPEGDDEPVDAEVVDEQPTEQAPDVLWHQILKIAGELGGTTSQVTADFEQYMSLAPGEASAGELATYLTKLQQQGLDGEAVPA